MHYRDKFKRREWARQRRKKHIRKRLKGTSERPRIVVYRSLSHIYAQLVDDTTNRTIMGVSSLSKEIRDQVTKAKSKCEVAYIVGKFLAQKVKTLNFEKVVFDRGGYLYHGRVKALAEGAREGGLVF